MGNPWDKDRYEAELASAVMEYLQRNPHATDTVKGIAEWWLDTRSELRVVRRVMDALAEQGLLERFGTGERVHYRLKKR
jgi:hypothetical protein